MARKIAPFTTSGNQHHFPHTRLQILYAAEFGGTYEPEGCAEPGSTSDFCGFTGTGTNEFTVPKGKQFYIPLHSSSDSDPVVGTWPGHRDGGAYFFSPEIGAEGYQVIIDGVATPLGPEYVVGPIGITHLYDVGPNGEGEGNEIITLAAFIDALPSGPHEVEIVGRLTGSQIKAVYGLDYFAIDFTYQVTVTG